MRVKCCLKLTQSCQNLLNIRVPSKRNFRHQCSIDECTNESHWCCSGCEMQQRRQQSEKIATPNNDEEDFWDNIMEDCASLDWSTILESQESHNEPQVKRKKGRPPKPSNQLHEATIKKKFNEEVAKILQSIDKLNLQCKENEWPLFLEITASSLQTGTGKRKYFRKDHEDVSSVSDIEKQIERIAFVKNKYGENPVYCFVLQLIFSILIKGI